MLSRLFAAVLVVTTPFGGAAVAKPPLAAVSIVAHRGASARHPEHSIPAYVQAITDGADFVELDLVPTRDGVLIVRHENELSETTDIADRPAFRDRRTEKRIDGKVRTGWFAEDMTLAEIGTLRLKERWPELRGDDEDGKHRILTFAEAIEVVARHAASAGRPIGLMPELKHSTYFRSIGLPLEDRMLAELAAHAFTRSAPILVQSFELANLRYVRSRIGKSPNIRLVQLIGKPDNIPGDERGRARPRRYGELLTPVGLNEVRSYADGIDPGKAAVIDHASGTPSSVVADAHRVGLFVVPGVFRPENRFLPVDLRDGRPETARNPGGSTAEIGAYLNAGIDMVFTDDPAVAREAIERHKRSCRGSLPC